MNFLQIAFILLTVAALSGGQLLFKLASTTIVFTPLGAIQALTNWRLVLALAIYALATLMWLYVLKTTPLRVAYPFAALSFVLVPILASLFLGESLSPNTWAGTALILAGIWVSASK